MVAMEEQKRHGTTVNTSETVAGTAEKNAGTGAGKSRLTTREIIHTWIAGVMLVMGVAFMWAGFFTPPMGDISNSVLGAAGECFTIGGGLLGLTQYVNRSLRDGFHGIRNELMANKNREQYDEDEQERH